MLPINLFLIGGTTRGGWVTYALHLWRALDRFTKVRLYRVTGRKSGCGSSVFFDTPVGLSSVETAVRNVRENPKGSVVVGFDSQSTAAAARLIDAGAALVVHDPHELGVRKRRYLAETRCARLLGIRASMLEHLSGVCVVPHPYVLLGEEHADWDRRKWAVSVSRIDSDKRTSMLLDANRLLPSDLSIDIRGFDMRQYSRLYLVPNYPEYKQSAYEFPPRYGEGVRVCGKHRMLVDMSKITGDGGGTQYTFLEGMDAGCIVVVHEDWIREGDEMQPDVNCVTVSGAADLAERIRYFDAHPRAALRLKRKLQPGVDALLEAHSPEVIGPQFIRALEGMPVRKKTLW